MKLLEYIDEMNVNEQLNYADYSNLHDMAYELEAENAELRERLEKAVILPYEIGKTVYWSIESEEKSFIIQEGKIVSYSIDNTGIWIFCRYNSGLTYWHKMDDFIKNVDTDRAKAEARLAELKGGEGE